MKPVNINTQSLEIHKPSSQITTTYEYGGKPFSLSAFQFDAMNFICYNARKQISDKYNLTSSKKNDPINKNNNLKFEQLKKATELDFEEEEELFNFFRNQVTTINLQELSTFTNKYNNGHRATINKAIKTLKDVSITVGYLKQDDFMQEDCFNLITRTSRRGNSNEIKIWLEPELILGWVFNATPFAKLLITQVATLKTVIAKKLYELLVDHAFKKYKKSEEIRTFSIEFNLMKTILNIPNNSASTSMSRVKDNYLNKALKDINEHTDLKIEKITRKKENKITTVTFYFRFDDNNQEKEQPIEDQILNNKLKLKSKAKLMKLEATGYDVKDEEKWIAADIKKYKEHYTAQTNLDDYIKEVDDMQQSDRLTLLGDLAIFLNAQDPVVIIDKNDYLIKDLSNNILTSSAKETREVLLKFQDFMEKEDEL